MQMQKLRSGRHVVTQLPHSSHKFRPKCQNIPTIFFHARFCSYCPWYVCNFVLNFAFSFHIIPPKTFHPLAVSVAAVPCQMFFFFLEGVLRFSFCCSTKCNSVSVCSRLQFSAVLELSMSAAMPVSAGILVSADTLPVAEASVPVETPA